ncbi:OmpA family protein [Flagellimonas sp. DF-77]|uniref:OmpA family protein n=1 Tax=Flagellimonas algarum TaxID=3230298 RepID=UPI0033970318
MKRILCILALLSITVLQAQTVTQLEFEDAGSIESEPSLVEPGIVDENLSKKERRKLLKQKDVKSKLIKKADEYYDKMWYAEAAKYYDLALAEDQKNPSKELLKHAGDSHYFVGNMEKAYHWYDLLYKNHGDSFSENDYFKYVHTLKGTGRKQRAKRILRAFNKADFGDDSMKETLLEKKSDIIVKNLAVNSKYSDFAPMYQNDGKVVFSSAADSGFFSTKRYKWNNQPFLDLYEANRNEDSGELSNAKKLTKKVNTKYHEAAVAFSSDGNTMYFTRNNFGKRLKRSKKNINHLKIYVSKKVDGEWQEADEVPFNGDNFSTGHPALSPDGKQLYFVSDRPGSIGGTDLYVVDLLEDGSYSEPRNLGASINTNKKEMFPYVTENAIYFSSNRSSGIGGLDVYKASYVGNAIATPENLGAPINSTRDDFSYIVDEVEGTGYFASNRKGGKGDDDIYAFKGVEPEAPVVEKTSAITGIVTDVLTEATMPNSVVALYDNNNEKIAETLTAEDGSFSFENLSPETDYVVRTSISDYLEDQQQVNTEQRESIDLTVPLKRIDDMIVVEDGVKKLKTEIIYFDFDSANIRQDASKELDKLVAVWEKYPNMVIKIESHTDSRGPSAYNDYLSDKRAKATKAYLVSRGIDASKIASAIGYGEQYPINDCKGGPGCDRTKHQQNRRSEFIIESL